MMVRRKHGLGIATGKMCNWGPDGSPTGAPTFMVGGQEVINYLNPQVAAYNAANSAATQAQSEGFNVPLPMPDIPTGCPPGTEITTNGQPSVSPANNPQIGSMTVSAPSSMVSSIPSYVWVIGAAALLYMFSTKN
jgi:hypothetical protein